MIELKSASFIIIALTAVVSIWCFSRPELKAKLLMNPYRTVHNKQWYRSISSAFVHGDYMHLFFNLFTFFFFGYQVERVFQYAFGGELVGSLVFAFMYLMAVIVSDLPTVIKHKDQIYYNSLGASGGVSAVVFAFIVFAPTQPICLFAVLCLPGFVLGGLYLIYSYYQSKGSSDNINHSAHLWGALFGFLFAGIFVPNGFAMFFDALINWDFQIF
ncbi:MAG: rhomboid family intramembrane serine protease [Bernardetiaceae bacterium]|nr:rhomboid family intramembrane serine protease [Bernardetiaceae bacterium]